MIQPSALIRANTTTTMCDRFAPGPVPKRVASHWAPVRAFERRSHIERKTIRKIWLKVGQSQGSQMPCPP